MSLRNGVPEMASRRTDGSNASRMESPHARSSAAWWISSKITNASVDSLPQHRGAGGHLLVGGDDAVHVRRQLPVGGRPRRVEVQGEAGGGLGPLHLEVGGGRHHDQPARGRSDRTWRATVRANVVLPAPGVATVKEVVLTSSHVLLEGGLLPRPEPDAAGHSDAGGKAASHTGNAVCHARPREPITPAEHQVSASRAPAGRAGRTPGEPVGGAQSARRSAARLAMAVTRRSSAPCAGRARR